MKTAVIMNSWHRTSSGSVILTSNIGDDASQLIAGKIPRCDANVAEGIHDFYDFLKFDYKRFSLEICRVMNINHQFSLFSINFN